MTLVRASHRFDLMFIYLCVLDAEDSGRQREGDEGGREEHFKTRDISFARLRLLVEGVGRVDAVAFGGAWQK